MPAMVTRLLATIDEIEPDLWDSLLQPGDYLASHRFVRACEHAGIGGAHFRHVLVFDGGRLAGLASLFRMDVSLGLLTDGATRRLFDRLEGWRPNLTRVSVVFCGLPVSLGGSCLRVAAEADPGRVVACVTAAMADFAADSGAGFLCCKELDQSEQGRLGPGLQAEGYFPVSSLPGCRLALAWPDLPAYENSMRSGYRRQVRLDRRAQQAARLRFEQGPGLQPDLATVHRLYAQVMARAPYRLEVLPEAFFQHLERAVPGQLHSIVGYLDDRPVANAILLWQAPVCHFLLVGLDYAHLARAHVYQNLVLEAVGSAIGMGAERLELGQTSYALKGRLGGQPTPRFIWLRHRGGMRHRLLAHAAPWLFPATGTLARQVFRTG